jgi:hypothetical protein
MGKRLDRITDYLWQIGMVAAVPAVIGLAMFMKPAPVRDNDRPFWSDGDHLKTCPSCRSGLTEFNALPVAPMKTKGDVVQETAKVPPASWHGGVPSQARTSLDG